MSEINFIPKVKQPCDADRCFFVGVREKESTSLADRLEARALITKLINMP